MKRLEPKESKLASLFLIIGIVGLFASAVYALYGVKVWNEQTRAIFGFSIAFSMQAMITSVIIQKIWNTEFYVEYIANNIHSPEYKSLATRPIPTTFSKETTSEEDISKYAPKEVAGALSNAQPPSKISSSKTPDKDDISEYAPKEESKIDFKDEENYTNENLKPCRVCSKLVAIGIKACPHCGAYYPVPGFTTFINQLPVILLFAILFPFLIWLIGSILMTM
jgi:hypothetical protein